MTPQELKNSILQLAIQGKLVEQRPEEGTAEELFRQIQAEKQKLIKAGTIKQEKPLPEIAEDEKPFDIPESWKWVRLGDIYKLIMGQSPDGESVSEGTCGIEFHQGKVFFGEDYLQKSNQITNKPSKIAEPYSVLLCVRAPVGILNITEREICIGRGLCAISTYAYMDAKYVLYSLRSYKTAFVKQATGTTFVAITGEVIKKQAVPLPPLAEQKRIVAKIEELLPYIDRYEEAWRKLEDFNKRFPTDMQKSILQTAIQGKLVEQRPEEGTGEELYRQIKAEKQRLIKAGTIKKEKPLSEITEDEKPFDIPESWKWVKVGNIFEVIRGSSPRPKGSPLYWTNEETEFHWVTIKDISDNAINGKLYQTHEYLTAAGAALSTYVDKEELIIAVSGSTTGKHCILGINGYIYDGLAAVINRTGIISSQYIMFFFDWVYEKLNSQKIGSAFPNINTDILKNTLIPLPPLHEQKRIVEKLQELLLLCQKLE